MANLGTVIADGTMMAAVHILRDRGLTTRDVNLDGLTVALRREATAALHEILDTVRGLDPTGITPAAEGAFRDLLNLACNKATRRAVATVA